MNKLNVFLAIGILFLLLSTISASYWIYSNVLTFQAQEYTLTLTSDVPSGIIAVNTTINFVAELKFGTEAVQNALLYLRMNETPLESKLSDSQGKATFSVLINATGTYNFDVAYQVP